MTVVVTDTTHIKPFKNIRCICYVYVEKLVVKILVILSTHVNETWQETQTLTIPHFYISSTCCTQLFFFFWLLLLTGDAYS